jgi:hypothetical protein
VRLSAEGVGASGILAATGTARTAVWRWQARCMEAVVDGPFRDRTRPPGTAPLANDRAAAIVATTLQPPHHEATHWTLCAMARAAGLAPATIRKAHGLAPHRWRRFTRSNAPACAGKPNGIVGRCAALRAHAVVPGMDATSQAWALDRTRPGPPLKKSRGPTKTPDHQRKGRTTPFAALNRIDGSVMGQKRRRHRHQGFIRCRDALERDIPAGTVVHVILDNDAAHAHAKVRAWAEWQRRWTFPCHADRSRMAERGGGLLRHAHPTTPHERRVPIRRRPPRGHQPLHCRTQPKPPAMHPAHRPQYHHRRAKPRGPSVGVKPRAGGVAAPVPEAADRVLDPAAFLVEL